MSEPKGRTRDRKRKIRWDPPSNIVTSFLIALPKFFPEGLTIEQTETLLVRILKNKIQLAYALNPQYADYTPVTSKKTKKIFIPIDRSPDYIFIEPRVERETGCNITIRGKGSVKVGKSKKGQSGEDEPLHVLLTADSEAQLLKAAQKIRDLLVPVEHKRQQLIETEINDNIRERIWIKPEPLSFDHAQVKCSICGEVSHPTSDCPLKGTSAVSYVETSHQIEYEKFLAEIRESFRQNELDSAYQEFMSTIDPTKAAGLNRLALATT